MKTVIRLILLSAGLWATGLLLTACGSRDEGETVTLVQPTTAVAATFAAAIPGSQAFVALVREGQQVLAYVCDGQTTAEWFLMS